MGQTIDENRMRDDVGVVKGRTDLGKGRKST